MSRLESFWRTVCQYRSSIWLFVMIHIFLLLLALVGLVASRPGTASHLLSIVNVAVLSVSGGLALFGFYRCTQRSAQHH